MVVENARFGRRFFTPPTLARKPLSFVLPAQKSEGTYRIFVLGESAAMGDPNPSYGCARMLERMLAAEYPGARFEVVNAGMVAINSHVILPIARDVARLEPDAFVIYMGNNEVVGPYGPGTAFHTFSSHLGMIRAGIALRGTRSGQMLERLLRFPSREADRTARWNGMQQFLDHRMAADDPRLADACRHFERNVRDIAVAGTDAGAQVVLCTVAVNLRTSPPFGATDEANAAFREAQQLEAAGRYDEARARYARARDLDTLRFRADGQINAAIRRVASDPSRRITLVDAEELFAKSAAHGIPGDDLFLEHVHMNFHGNFVLAAAMRDALAGQFPASIADRRSPGTRLTETDCARLLAFTAWSRFALDEDVYRRLGTPPFTFQLDHEARSAAMARDLEARRESAGQAGLAEARRACMAAIERAPEDWVLHQDVGNLLIEAGDFSGAIDQFKRVFSLIPHAQESYHRDAFALAQQGKAAEAIALILTHNPDRPRDAADVYAKLSSVLIDRAIALGQQGRRLDALACFRQALTLNPNDADAHYNLAMALAGQGQWAEAIRHLERVLELDPDDAEARAALGAARSAAATPPGN